MNPETKWLQEYLDSHAILPEMQAAVNNVQAWACADHGYDSKNARIKEWVLAEKCNGLPFYEIVCQIFINTLMHPEGLTYQAMIGSIAGQVKCADPLDRAKCAAEVIAICYLWELIEITKVSDKVMLITTEFDLGVDIPQFDKHLPVFAKPEPVAYNPILGNVFKQHENDVCRDHIDLMNSIPLALEYRVITDRAEEPNKSPQTEEQWADWFKFVDESLAAYSKVAQKNRPFYLEHSVDTRGRTYCSGFYINYQGASFKKAIVKLADKEVVKL
jgi:hypothetical protein